MIVDYNFLKMQKLNPHPLTFLKFKSCEKDENLIPKKYYFNFYLDCEEIFFKSNYKDFSSFDYKSPLKTTFFLLFNANFD